VYFVKDQNQLPFLMKKAEQAKLPALVRIYEYENLSKIDSLLKKPGEGIWQYGKTR